MADQFQIVSGREDKEWKDMEISVAWESAPDRKTVTFTCTPVGIPEGAREEFKPRADRKIIVHITGDVEIHPGIETLDGSLELRQWASLLIWCTRLAYDKVYYIFNVDQLRFK